MTARLLHWSVRRELWEHRSVYLAPLAVALLVLLGSLLRVAALPRRLAALPADDPGALHALLVGPFRLAPAPIMLASFLVGMYYALDALYGERRDRSILFWKSMPVSDRLTVASKALVPLALLPLLAFALSVATTAVLLLAASALLAGGAVGPGRLWAEVRYFQQVAIMFYGLAVHALWLAPVYGWLMAVSAWAKRAPFLWAVLPPLAAGAAERLAFGTSHVCGLIRYRFAGAMSEAFVLARGDGDVNRLTQLDPLGFVASPGLWLGLAFALASFAAAARLRRRREPI